ncbi:MAG: DJ-1/PfpI family protein [Nanobdellota archaeon]
MREHIYILLAQEGFRDEELLKPLEVIKPSRFTPVLASPKKGTCTGMLGTTIESEMSISDITINEETKGILIVGGKGALSIQKETNLSSILDKANEKNIIIGAICVAPILLANAGILKDKYATVYKTEESLKAFKDNKVEFLDKEVVEDGTIVTANGPESATAFAQRVIDSITEQEEGIDSFEEE